MELRHIRYFVAAAKDLNISKASRRVHVSQPAMSRLIRDLEDELGAALFVREQFGLRLTPAGKKFLESAEQMLEICDKAVQAIGRMPKGETMLKVGFIAPSLGTFLGEALRTFRSRHPGTQVKILEMSPGDQIQALRSRQIDLALLGNYGGQMGAEFALKTLFQVKFKAVVPGRHPLARRRSLGLNELAGEDFVGYNELHFPGRNQRIVEVCERAGFSPRLKSHGDSLVAMLGMIGAGVGVGLMPTDVASLPHPNAVFIRLREEFPPVDFAAAWRPGDQRPMLLDFIASLNRLEAENRQA